MQTLPHTYSAELSCAPDASVVVTSPGLPRLETAPPAEFGGPGDQWSPETLLLASVADCFALTFRAVASASNLEWLTLECRVEGLLDKVEKGIAFTQLTVGARLTVPSGVREQTAERLLAKAEHNCLISNSLAARVELEAEVVVAG